MKKKMIIQSSQPKSAIDINKLIGLREGKRLTIDISEELHTALKSKVAASKTSMADVIRFAIKAYCEDKE